MLDPAAFPFLKRVAWTCPISSMPSPIHLTNAMARAISADPVAKDRLSVAFLPNYRVSMAELIFPAAELSEQISTAGTEASGTGNMKAALNGALTNGTLDGGCFQSLGQALVDSDHYFHCADYASYLETQERVSVTYANPAEWARMSILNVAGMGKFSIDRTVREYARDIWQAPFVPVPQQ